MSMDFFLSEISDCQEQCLHRQMYCCKTAHKSNNSCTCFGSLASITTNRKTPICRITQGKCGYCLLNCYFCMFFCMCHWALLSDLSDSQKLCLQWDTNGKSAYDSACYCTCLGSLGSITTQRNSPVSPKASLAITF